ncbi:SLBB domain-containing protein, partial [Paraglaciecola sp.]|uniref:SLBB domain-containing protein n=1 Tax=Paraglaciecola sp. TaxID=1920173 RepID=UPI0030F38E59
MLRQFQISSLVLILLFGFFSSWVEAQSAQQIEQFKKLPKAQQEQLARQMGVDLSSLESLSNSTLSSKNGSKNSESFSGNQRFDEYGNPVVEKNKSDKTLLDEDEDKKLKLYGSELFSRETASLGPSSGAPVPSNYLIAPGDQLVVQLFGKENEEYNLEVGRDGNIVVPRLGPIAVATKSFAEAKSYLSEQIKKKIIGVEVSVIMGELTTIRVFVMGEALKPGAYNVSSLSTITHALVVSGGVSDIASLRNVQLKRAGKLVTTLDVYDLLNQGDSTNDSLLRSGDVIFIPTIERSVSVDGQVRRPAIYELKNESTLADVINLAGGKLPQAYESAISIQRFINGSRIQITAELNSHNTKIIDGDSILIPEVSTFLSGSITLIGAVARPGDYQWKNSLRIRDIIVDVQKDLLEFADLSYVLILREINRNRDIEILQTSLLDENISDNVSNVVLQPNDKVVVFSKNENDLLADTTLSDMAYSKKELSKKEKELWQKRIEEKLFWKSIGISDDKLASVLAESEAYAIQNQPIIQLTDEEKEQVLEFKNYGFFSRKRLLAPILEKLNQQARMDSPLQILEIAGEVKIPGVYPLTKNATIKSVVIAAGGFTESSYMKKSEITRSEISPDGTAQISHISFSPSDIWQTGVENELALQSKDRINIFATPSWQQELKVTVKGEVEFPGEYSIRRGETLSNLMARVGYLTEYGDADAAVFTRETLKEQEQENLQKLAGELRKQIASISLRKQTGAGSIVSYDEAKKLLKDLTDVDAVGRLVIDFKSILAGSKKDNVILEDGDVLYVPGKSQSVNVIGEVYVPTSHMFTDGITFNDYISKSGGYRASADKERTYVIRANGSVFVPDEGGDFWFSSNKVQLNIKAGDTIVVPLDS